MARFSLGSDWRRLFWMGSLILLSVAFSLGFSCAVPLAPFATIGALTLRRHDAFVLIGAVWLAAQWVNGRLSGRNRVLGSSATFLAAFAAYEGALFAISTASANGVSNFAPAIVLRIFLINAVAFAVLLLVHRLIAVRGLENKEETLLSAQRVLY